MMAFAPGERVRITIIGIVRDAGEDVLGEEILIEYATEGDIVAAAPIVTNAEAVTIEPLGPPDWPPTPGQLWQDRDGDPWFAVEGPETDEVVMVGKAGGAISTNELISSWGPVKLIHPPKDQQRVDEPCGCDHHGDHAGCREGCECAR